MECYGPKCSCRPDAHFHKILDSRKVKYKLCLATRYVKSNVVLGTVLYGSWHLLNTLEVSAANSLGFSNIHGVVANLPPLLERLSHKEQIS